jgi:hypothetical protein
VRADIHYTSLHREARPADKSPAELAGTILRLYLDQRVHELRPLLHPEADLEAGFAAPGTRLSADATIDAAWVAMSSGAYRPEYACVETLDSATALVGAKIRYEIGEGLFSERDAAMVMTFKDGLLWRTRIYDSIDEALEAHETRRE